jgi:uncharacterized protein YbjT (DUF2867 family)
MYVVTRATGKVGRATARALLEHRLPVRVIVQDADKGAELRTTPPLGKRDKRVIQMFSARKFASQTLILGHR